MLLKYDIGKQWKIQIIDIENISTRVAQNIQKLMLDNRQLKIAQKGSKVQETPETMPVHIEEEKLQNLINKNCKEMHQQTNDDLNINDEVDKKQQQKKLYQVCQLNQNNQSEGFNAIQFQSQLPTFNPQMQENLEKIKTKKSEVTKHIPSFLLPEYLKYLKGIFIYQEIITRIEEQNLLDIQIQRHLEFMMLVSRRASLYINSFDQSLSKFILDNPQTDIFDTTELPEKWEVETFKSVLNSKFLAYNTNINHINKKLRKRIRSISQLVYVGAQKQNKYKFIDGYEGPDYSSKQQIVFTYDKYIESILNAQKISSPLFKNHRLKKILRAYRDICFIGEDQQFKIFGNDDKIDSTNIQNKAIFMKAINEIILNQ